MHVIEVPVGTSEINLDGVIYRPNTANQIEVQIQEHAARLIKPPFEFTLIEQRDLSGDSLLLTIPRIAAFLNDKSIVLPENATEVDILKALETIVPEPALPIDEVDEDQIEDNDNDGENGEGDSDNDGDGAGEGNESTVKKLTADEIKAKLDGLGVGYPPKAGIKALQAILDEHLSEKE